MESKASERTMKRSEGPGIVLTTLRPVPSAAYPREAIYQHAPDQRLGGIRLYKRTVFLLRYDLEKFTEGSPRLGTSAAEQHLHPPCCLP